MAYASWREFTDLACKFWCFYEDGFVGGVGFSLLSCADYDFYDWALDEAGLLLVQEYQEKL